MKPRGLRATWQRSRHCLTYAFDLGQPSRAQELRDALKAERQADDEMNQSSRHSDETQRTVRVAPPAASSGVPEREAD